MREIRKFHHKNWHKSLLTSALAIAFLSPVILAGCSGRVEYRAYDPYYSDYHPWNHDEVVYYQNWETSTHRSHVDFQKRTPDDQKEYFTWRHSQH